jgi:hypothetical protein
MTVREWIEQEFEEVVVCDGLDGALLGIASGCGRPDTAVYSVAKILDILMTRDGMTEENAEDYFGFNIEGGYCEGAPMFLRTPPGEEAEERMDLMTRLTETEVTLPADTLRGS